MKRRKMKLWKKIIIGLFAIIVFAIGGTLGYTFWQLDKMDTTTISKTDEDLGIKTKSVEEEALESKVTNIALFGVDRRNKNEPARSDSIMILSIDEKSKKIKMSSVMRDTYVNVNGHGKTKITHAYFYGGPQLAIRTLNENFEMDIRNYVTVDFFNLEKIIDAIGGVTVDVQKNEVGYINSYMSETTGIQNKSITRITNSGSQNLNGMQAVAYTRIRYTAGDDFARTERQRTVLSAMLTEIQSLGVAEFPSVVSELLPLTETSMNSIDIIKLGTKVFTSGIKTLDQERFPIDGYWEGQTIDKIWYLVAKMDATVDQLHKYIYEDIKPNK
ncbi:LCP family protein [Clostridium sp.]|uniref:LCP family protein n=1 Tax=Clostridium sp. TaxID=1506 RepID=UPI001A5FF650|nr:LCP family protein [Clostridium sp.]MBK5240653.1 LCP family protein [Clostridium sp.]